MPRPAIERRRSPRYLCSQIVEVRRQQPDADPAPATAVLEDLSAEGAGVAVEAPMAVGQSIELVTPGLQAPAKVRYCLARENDFRLGLEFCDGHRWDLGRWQPGHLFLPPAE